MSKKQEPPIKRNAFVHKLYSMLSDEGLSHLIWWTRDEESSTFALRPSKEFASALTGYFKHGNVASFVRQLHMYGFHKVSDPSQNSGSEKDMPVWEFKHSSGKFRKNDESSLIYIKRRSSSNSSRGSFSGEAESNVFIPTSTPSPDSIPFNDPMVAYYQGNYIYPRFTSAPTNMSLGPRNLSYPMPQGSFHHQVPSNHGHAGPQSHQYHSQSSLPNPHSVHIRQSYPQVVPYHGPPYVPISSSSVTTPSLSERYQNTHSHPMGPNDLHRTASPHNTSLLHGSSQERPALPLQNRGEENHSVSSPIAEARRQQQTPAESSHNSSNVDQTMPLPHPSGTNISHMSQDHLGMSPPFPRNSHFGKDVPTQRILPDPTMGNHHIMQSPTPLAMGRSIDGMGVKDHPLDNAIKRESKSNEPSDVVNEQVEKSTMKSSDMHNGEQEHAANEGTDSQNSESGTPHESYDKNMAKTSNPDTGENPHSNSSIPHSYTPTPSSADPLAKRDSTAQYYTPNLQFRKIWETNNKQSRPRNPSLLFDPLAPVPLSSTPNFLSGRQSPHFHDSDPKNQSHQQHNVYASVPRPGSVGALNSISREIHMNVKDSGHRPSVKLPPASSLHRNSSLTSASSSLSFSSDSESSTSTVMPMKFPRSIPPSDSGYRASSLESGSRYDSSSVPSSPSGMKKPSLPSSSGFHEKLRPSLIEIYFGPGQRPSSSWNVFPDSIGSQSSNNSLFSNNSSLSSHSSIQRASSLRSISQNAYISTKNSISVSSNDEVVSTSGTGEIPGTVPVHKELENSSSPMNSPRSAFQQQSHSHHQPTPVAPKVNDLIYKSSPKRPSLGARTSSASKIKRLTSPLSRQVIDRLEAEDASAAEGMDGQNQSTKVSIHSLLDIKEESSSESSFKGADSTGDGVSMELKEGNDVN
ncbi:Piso0_000106 [Millerozyma farinosa CBS 7064]|uniref:Piso0_000106 protein n=1 Tax=Pichia sorbitophila (strain ATCC MYA-4447 / BCRC 22081 / CBS 7064 / NBRC 10061 / NRRL Y-12695) TaxID=559304 RepID=G8YUJ1_PICSO|nr:Piso0_000106 [Millerozyma farinosa CBS 7064]